MAISFLLLIIVSAATALSTTVLLFVVRNSLFNRETKFKKTFPCTLSSALIRGFNELFGRKTLHKPVLVLFPHVGLLWLRGKWKKITN
jgi:hypothetical protein